MKIAFRIIIQSGAGGVHNLALASFFLTRSIHFTSRINLDLLAGMPLLFPFDSEDLAEREDLRYCFDRRSAAGRLNIKLYN
ncbi:MAG TPA: hypothetical protein PK843_13915 [bacterium]|nr:hypothetical protein [bacterium]